MEHTCTKECLVVNRDGTIVCNVTGVCKQQYICRNDYVPKGQLFAPFETKCGKKQRKSHKATEPKQTLNTVREKTYITNKIEQITTTRLLADETDTLVVLILRVFLILHAQNALKGKKQAIVVSILYLTRQGKEYTSINGTVFDIPKIEGMINVLPPINDLRDIGIRKNQIRIGSNLIQRVLRNI